MNEKDLKKKAIEVLQKLAENPDTKELLNKEGDLKEHDLSIIFKIALSALLEKRKNEFKTTEQGKKTVIHIDGGSYGNPGPSACAVIIEKNGKIVLEHSEYLGKTTNNCAEYLGLRKAMELALQIGLFEVAVFSDSELLVNQVNGLYKTKDMTLRKLLIEVLALKRKFKIFELEHIPREKNTKADKLVKKELNLRQLTI